MELQKCDEPKTTTHYWGYRELSADELLMVGGGDDGGDGDGDGGCDAGGSCDSGAASDNGGQDVAGLGCNLVGGLVGVTIAEVAGPFAGLIGGVLATAMCEKYGG